MELIQRARSFLGRHFQEMGLTSIVLQAGLYLNCPEWVPRAFIGGTSEYGWLRGGELGYVPVSF